MKRKPKKHTYRTHKKYELVSFEAWMWDLLNDVFELAKEYGWSISRLAAEAQLSANTVYRLRSEETREPRARTLFKLARAVGMTLDIIQTHYRKAS